MRNILDFKGLMVWDLGFRIWNLLLMKDDTSLIFNILGDEDLDTFCTIALLQFYNPLIWGIICIEKLCCKKALEKIISPVEGHKFKKLKGPLRKYLLQNPFHVLRQHSSLISVFQ